jgi:cation diffusion facilitator CzcD-associated flavoprotein CzcO
MNNQIVAVLGAGPCGLAACKTLAEFGIPYECLEATDALGGIWNVERGGGGYRSLLTNTSTTGMAYTGFPFEDDSPIYPDAAQMVDYFKRYAEHFQITKNIRFNTGVLDARPLEDSTWALKLDNGETRPYSSVIVATGQYTLPRRIHDSTPGTFAGEHLHVSDYLDVATPIDLRNKRVVVVGLGTSAVELAAELANDASQVIVSARSGRWVVPRSVDGTPIDGRSPHPSDRVPPEDLALPGDEGPTIARQKLAKNIRELFDRIGGAEGLGLPEPAIEPWEERPSTSNDFIPALKAGRIDVRPGIQRFEGDTVHFTDGTHAQADAILYATGYQLDFPYISKEVLGCEAPDLALYQRIVHPAHDGLYFIGCLRVMCSLWPVAEQQSRWIARHLTGAFDLPSEEERVAQAVTLTKAMPVMCNFYIEGLRAEADGFQIKTEEPPS